MSICISDDLYDKLKHSIPSKKISQFVSSAITKELDQKEQELLLAYQNVENDRQRQDLLNEWDAIDDFS